MQNKNNINNTTTTTSNSTNTTTNKKLKIGLLSPISYEWFNLHLDVLENSNDISEVDYIIYESNGDPIHMIEKIKLSFPKEKLVFILSGDQSNHIDDECIWFSNAVKLSGLAKKQTQIFVTNPAIFKFYELYKIKNDMVIETQSETQSETQTILNKYIYTKDRQTDIYFKGTIWDGMRTDMYNSFINKSNCKIIKNNNYWKWRCESPVKPKQEELEKTAFESYYDLCNSKLCLCPKGNGNSSMRIIEALACGSVPIIIDDFSSPFGISWGNASNEIALVFDSNKHNWKYIYNECNNLINDNLRYEKMKYNGIKYFENFIYCDSKISGFKMYDNIDTVAFGFSKNIITKLCNDF